MMLRVGWVLRQLICCRFYIFEKFFSSYFHVFIVNVLEIFEGMKYKWRINGGYGKVRAISPRGF